MRRNVVSLLKFCCLAAFAVLVTILVFRYVRGPPPRRQWTQQPPVPLAQHPKQPQPLVQNVIENPDEDNALEEQEQDEKPTNDKIDWHNHKLIADEGKRKGKGEQGKPSQLSPMRTMHKEKLYQVNGFNAALSDEISLNRSIPDIRHTDCKRKMYSRHLQAASVVVTFHNEHMSTLMRTCWSVINRSPAELLQEIILVDDASTKAELRGALDDYVEQNLPKVKIIRLPKRSGLIRGRLAGARQAKAPIILFLDSHSEANVNWLPPLLEPIVENYKICVCPFIDVVDYETFEYRAQDEGARGAFDWELYYKRLPLLPEDLQNPAEPFKSPVMAGGLFAISAKFFWELGGYDPGLDIWGGEQYELSFKIWQCGGEMYDAPCSRVGHIYRKFPPFPNPGKGDFLGRNYKRVAEVWMDEYAEYIYKRRSHLRAMDPGDLTEQKALREKLQCKPFKWFMEEIAFDLIETYPPIEPPDFAFGEIRSMGQPELCLDSKSHQKDESVVVNRCAKDDTNEDSSNQEFRMSWRKDVQTKGQTTCFDVSSSKSKSPVTLYPCHGKQGNQLWRYNVKNQWLVHGSSSSARCLDFDLTGKAVYVTDCDENAYTQRWRIENVNITALNNWDNVGPKVN